jgi:hypothetical protein
MDSLGKYSNSNTKQIEIQFLFASIDGRLAGWRAEAIRIRIDESDVGLVLGPLLPSILLRLSMCVRSKSDNKNYCPSRGEKLAEDDKLKVQGGISQDDQSS